MVIGKIVVNKEVDKFTMLDICKRMRDAGIDNVFTDILYNPLTIQVEPSDSFFCTNDIGADGCHNVDCYIVKSQFSGEWVRVCTYCYTDEEGLHYDSDFIDTEVMEANAYEGQF